jgi:putative Mg2+ transporter-C (MgtC) family protein
MEPGRGRRYCDGTVTDMVYEELLGGLALPLPIVAARLVGAALLCALIGMEREAADRAAGLRTHMLVGMAAAAFALITLHLMEIHTDRPEVVRLDPIRLVEAATAGVAFLAAGMIFLTRGRVRNLTTGAGMWLAAAIGLAAGLGYWPIAVMAAVLGFAIQLLGRVTHREE